MSVQVSVGCVVFWPALSILHFVWRMFAFLRVGGGACNENGWFGVNEHTHSDVCLAFHQMS